MSTPNNSAYLSPNETLNDLTSPAEATTLDLTKGLPQDGNGKVHKHPFEGISSARRGILMAIFATATALDVVNVSALVTATAQIARDLKLEAGNITWVITAYALTFAGFLLFAGRLSDLYRAQFIFLGGFFMLGVLLLVDSFISNKYAFLVLRALQGISGAMTIPSAYHLIVHLYPVREQQQVMLSILGLAGAISNSLGVVLGGLFELGDSNWRWLFRFMAITALSASASGAIFMPYAKTTHEHSQFTRLQRMDLVGVFLLTSSLCLFILGLTSGTTDGWTDAHFLAPFLISVVLFVGFWVWEFRQDNERALLPRNFMGLPNIIILCVAALTPYLWWGTTQFGYANLWQTPAYGHSAILVAARLLPEGVAGIIGGMVVQGVPQLLQRPKYTVKGGAFLSVAPGLILMIFSDGGRGKDYWRFVFPGMAIGSFGVILMFLALNVSIIQAVPPSASGVAGALLQTVLQIGSVIGLSVQAGLYASVDNDLTDWEGSRNYMYFDIAWISSTIILFGIFYKPQASNWVSDAPTEKVGEKSERLQSNDSSPA